jgi:hypothetical protein
VIRRTPSLLKRAVALALLAPALAALAQSEAELKRYAELDRKCELARERKLAPLRAAKIEECVQRDKRPREQCEREFTDWGNTQALASGRARAGLFYDLPECVAAEQARRQYRQ